MAEKLTTFYVVGSNGALTLLMAKDLAAAQDQAALLFQGTTRTKVRIVERRYQLLESINHDVDFVLGTST